MSQSPLKSRQNPDRSGDGRRETRNRRKLHALRRHDPPCPRCRKCWDALVLELLVEAGEHSGRFLDRRKPCLFSRFRFFENLFFGFIYVCSLELLKCNDKFDFKDPLLYWKKDGKWCIFMTELCTTVIKIKSCSWIVIKLNICWLNGVSLSIIKKGSEVSRTLITNLLH